MPHSFPRTEVLATLSQVHLSPYHLAPLFIPPPPIPSEDRCACHVVKCTHPLRSSPLTKNMDRGGRHVIAKAPNPPYHPTPFPHPRPRRTTPFPPAAPPTPIRPAP